MVNSKVYITTMMLLYKAWNSVTRSNQAILSTDSINMFRTMDKTVCVTGAAGFTGSWLVMRLLQRGYVVRATVQDPKNLRKVQHLLDFRNAEIRSSQRKTDLGEEGSFDEVIQGRAGVFHLATPMDFESEDPEVYFVSKTLPERAAWKYAKENNIDFISIIPTLVAGPFITSSMTPSLITALSSITGNEARYSIRRQDQFGHLDDLCNAHIDLFEHPKADAQVP